MSAGAIIEVSLGMRKGDEYAPTWRSPRIRPSLQPTEVVAGIISCRFGEWENYARLLAWVRRAHPAKHRALVQAMDWNALDAVVVEAKVKFAEMVVKLQIGE
jgi:hypothetical protein